MLTEYFLKGLVIGFTIAAPVGPINVLCVRRTIVHGRLAGLASGLGAALADTTFGFIAAFGLFFLVELLKTERVWLNAAGAVLLAVAAVRTYYAGPPLPRRAPDPSSLIGDLTSTFVLTLTNPITVFSFMAIYAAFDIQPSDSISPADLLLLLGVFLGAMVWWTMVVEFVGLFRKDFTAAGFKWANRISGIVIMGFALVVAVDTYRVYREGPSPHDTQNSTGLRDPR
jgi:threonine/homoserine/homoserine lactone efflux protein